MTESETKRLRELEQREAAREAIFQYALGLDTNNPDLLRRVFAEDMEFDRPPADICHGREAAMVHFDAALAGNVERLKHFITNPIITSTGENTLAAQANLFALVHIEDALSLAFGHYQINVRVDGDTAVITKLGIYLDVSTAPVRGMLGRD